MSNEASTNPENQKRSVLTVRHILLFLVLVGIVFRLTSVVWRDVGFDANYYLVMGQSLAQRGEFYMPWGDLSNLNGVPSYSHHMSPLFPAYIGSFYALFGFFYIVAKFAAVIVSILTIAVIFWTTKNLYGKERGLVAAAIFALSYELIVETGKLYSENFTLLFFTLTMWAIIRGVKEDKYIVYAGLFAGLAYLSRSSLGYFFIIAGVGGFLWRFYYMRWGVFKNKWYLLAIAIFLGFVGGWGLRNLSHFGWPNWETSAAIQQTILNAFSQPIRYLELILLLIPFFIMILLTYAAFWLPEFRASLRRIRDEQVSGLWLAVFLIPFIAIFVSGALSLDETQKGVTLFWRDRVRYVLYAFVPIVWLGIRAVDFRLGTPVKDALRGLKVSAIAILERIRQIARNRTWMGSISLLLLATVVSLVFIGGWLAAFLLVGAFALFFKSPRKRLAIFLAILLVFSIEAGTAEVKFASPQAGQDLNSSLSSGEYVAVDSTTYHHLYFLYPFIDDAENRIVLYQENLNTTYIASFLVNRTYSNYSPIGNYYDISRGGVISEGLGSIVGASTYVSKLTLIVWKHD